jgi:hypothetical protein
MARQNGNRSLRRKYAVLGDGLTEQFYLKYLKEIKGYGYSVSPTLFRNIEIKEASRIIDRLLKEGHNGIVYLTDFDTIVNQRRLQDFNNLKALYNKNPEVLISETMPSVELWFLLHYQYTTQSFQNATEALNALKKHMPRFEKRKVWLEKSQWVNELCADNKMEVAIENAKSLDKARSKGNVDSHHPFSMIYKAVEMFEQWKE